MMIVSLVQKLSSLGIFLSVDQSNTENIIYDAPKGIMTSTLKSELRINKAAIHTYLRGRGHSKANFPLANIIKHDVSSINQDDIKFDYEERAAILEYDGQLTRKEAEERAYNSTLQEFIGQAYPHILKELDAIIYKKES